MVKPILLVTVSDDIVKNNADKEKAVDSIKKSTGNEYHVLVATTSRKNVFDLEVHNGRNECLKVTGDLVTRIQGKDIEFVINKNNEGRKRGS